MLKVERHAEKVVDVVVEDPTGRIQWDPLESTCRHASLSIL